MYASILKQHNITNFATTNTYIKYKYLYNLYIYPGTGEAGKSTFLKQMKILNGDGFTNEEKEEFKQIVFKNLVQSIQTIIVAMDELYIPYDSDENQVRVYTK